MKSVTRRAIVLGALATSVANDATAAEAAFGPKVGSKAPAAGILLDQSGTPRTLDKLSGRKGLVLMFYRSAAWCPYCQAQLITMNDGAAEIKERGYNIVGISYEPPAVNLEFTKRRSISYTLLSDPGSKIIDTWGLRDPQYAPGSKAYGVPRPIIFVIDRKGIVRASIARERFQERPPVTEVVEALDGLH
jgi:peroxiredoxin